MPASDPIKNRLLDELFQAILLLETKEECYRFFEDIFTVSELLAVAQRLEVAKLLSLGKTQKEISQKLGASTATISRVNRALKFGAGGYQQMLLRLEKEFKKVKSKKSMEDC